MARIVHLQVTYCDLRTVSGIDEVCSQANELLRKVSVVLPDVACLSRLDYDTSKRADPEALQNIVKHAQTLRVSVGLCVLSPLLSINHC